MTKRVRVGFAIVGTLVLMVALLQMIGSNRNAPTRALRSDTLEPSEEAEPLQPRLPVPEAANGAGEPLRSVSPAPVEGQKPPDEASTLAKLRDLAASDPIQSLQLAQDALRRFPESPNAPEFAWNVVKALFNMERIEEAKDEARIMLWKYPGNYFTNDVDHHLLNHPP